MKLKYKFVETKSLDYNKLRQYLKEAEAANRFSNYGYAARTLEERARTVLGIERNKAVIAVSSGTAALHLAGYLKLFIAKLKDEKVTFTTQSFTFYSANSGPFSKAKILDFVLDPAYCPFSLSNPGKSDNLKHLFLQLDKECCNIVTNLFGKFIHTSSLVDTDIIYDNATAPLTYINSRNVNNLGFASAISLHHTKPIGFGEGGLLIVDREYEPIARELVNFNKVAPQFGSNYKMSELAAAGILQWWNSVDFKQLKAKYIERYNKLLNHYNEDAIVPFYDNNMDFMPSCLPLVFKDKVPTELLNNPEVKKYYKPLDGSVISNYLYDKIVCLPLGD